MEVGLADYRHQPHSLAGAISLDDDAARLFVAGAARAYSEAIVETVREPLLILGASLRVVSANRAFYDNFGVAPYEVEERRIYDLGDGQWNIPALRHLLEDIIPRDSTFEGFEVEHVFPHVGRKIMLLNARKLFLPGDYTEMLLLAIEDITDRRRVEAELAEIANRNERIAETLQRSLLLTNLPDALPGLIIKSAYEPASDEALVGGDFFDVFRVDDYRAALIMGDVTGKGLQAATFTAEAKFALRMALREDRDPARAFYRLNNHMIESRRLALTMVPDAYVSLAVVVIDIVTGDAYVASAGAEPPLVHRAATGEVEIMEGGMGPLIGVQHDSAFQSISLRLEIGDLIMLTTDGITESRTPKTRDFGGQSGGEFFDLDGITRVLRREALHPVSLESLAEVIVDDARVWAGGSFRDDVCLLLARFVGLGAA